MTSGGVRVERSGPVTTVIMNRPEARNAVNGPAAAGLYEAFDEFEKDDSAAVAVLWGDNGTFCAGADLMPLIDGGTVRLPRLIGHSRAMDMTLTGRGVDAAEAQAMGLANRVVPKGQARQRAEELAAELAELPQQCMRSDRLSMLNQWGASEAEAMDFEFASISRVAAESLEGAARFAAGAGRHGASG
jgi:enoyl-CoA hydratase/carnithine racemase